MEIPLGETTINLNEKTILIYGDYSKVFPFIISLIEMNESGAVLLLDDFSERTLLDEIGCMSSEKLSKTLVSKFENLVQLDKALEQSETILIKNSFFKILLISSLPNAYLREISLHESSSHSNILYLLNKILAFFSFLSREYGCTGILTSSGRSLEQNENIPAKRIFMYWTDYILELRNCIGNRLLGKLKAKSGGEIKICIPFRKFKELSEIRICMEDECPRSF
ncbi:MAG: hypothetical protein RMI79_04890 [Nitrososphaerota archaeon]|nr:hypothetical protein [Nitrososphaerota archaeon]